jgi:hypothetical protein
MHTPARNTDPHTSHEAAEFMQASGKRAAQQQLTATAVAQYPGLTSLELARKCKMDRYMLARRLSECEQAKQVRRGEAKRCSVSGRTALTWWPPGTPIQLELAAA